MTTVRTIDSHTAGEPTRVVLEGAPPLQGKTIAQQLEDFRQNHDRFRSAVVNEPRGSDVLVGALLLPPADPSCQFGVIFFNNVGCLGMCGHGTIGLIATLRHLGRLQPGPCRIDTSVGPVTATLHSDGEVSLTNVPSWRAKKDLAVQVPGHGPLIGDVAWGGNWFFLVGDHGMELTLGNVDRLTAFTWAVRQAVNSHGYAEVDHIELFGPPQSSGADSRNFVLCPGKAYDRSPCGTGTSAKLACLAADGQLAEGEAWVQESMIGSRFTASFAWVDPVKLHVAPTIRGRAYVNAETRLIFDAQDPFCWGIR